MLLGPASKYYILFGNGFYSRHVQGIPTLGAIGVFRTVLRYSEQLVNNGYILLRI